MTDHEPDGASIARDLDTMRDNLSPEMQEAHDRLLDGLRGFAEACLAMEAKLLSDWHDRRTFPARTARFKGLRVPSGETDS